MTSTELWECLNDTTYNALAERERAAKGLGPHEFFSFIEGRAAMFAGLADSTLSRDDGYRFMVLGRAIERVDMTVRLLLSRVGDSASSPAWVTVLRSAGAHDTYLRTYRGVRDAGRVVEFILLDRLFPRSVFLLAAAGRTQPRRARPPPAQPGGSHRRSTAAARPHPQRAGVPASRRAAGNPGAAIGRTAEGLPRYRRSRGAAVLSLRTVGGLGRRRTTQWGAGHRGRGDLMWRMRVVHSTGYAYKSPATAS